MIKQAITTALLQAGWEIDPPTEAGSRGVVAQSFQKAESIFVLRETLHPTVLLLQIQAHLQAFTELVLSLSVSQHLLYVQHKGKVFISPVARGRHRHALRHGFLHLLDGTSYLQFAKGDCDAWVMGLDHKLLDPFNPIPPAAVDGAPAFSFYPIHALDRTSRRLLGQMIYSKLEHPELHLYREAKWLELLSRIILQLKRQDHVPSAAGEGLTKVTLEHYIAQRLEDNLTVQTIARHFHMSESALKQRFARLFHSPIHQYILHQKLDRARQLLLNERLTVYAVALQCGFSDSSHFIKRFKQRFGITPLQYQRTHGQ